VSDDERLDLKLFHIINLRGITTMSADRQSLETAADAGEDLTPKLAPHEHAWEIDHELPGSADIKGPWKAVRLRCTVEGCTHQVNAVLERARGTDGQIGEATPGASYDPSAPKPEAVPGE